MSVIDNRGTENGFCPPHHHSVEICVPFHVQQQCKNLYKNTFLNFLGTNTLSKYCGRALRTLKSNK